MSRYIFYSSARSIPTPKIMIFITSRSSSDEKKKTRQNKKKRRCRSYSRNRARFVGNARKKRTKRKSYNIYKYKTNSKCPAQPTNYQATYCLRFPRFTLIKRSTLRCRLGIYVYNIKQDQLNDSSRVGRWLSNQIFFSFNIVDNRPGPYVLKHHHSRQIVQYNERVNRAPYIGELFRLDLTSRRGGAEDFSIQQASMYTKSRAHTPFYIYIYMDE